MNRLPRPNVGRGDGREDQQHGCHEGADCGVGPVETVVRGLHGDGLGDDRRCGLVGRRIRGSRHRLCGPVVQLVAEHEARPVQNHGPAAVTEAGTIE